VQETRLWNENRDQTEPMRTKENAQDYRFFPEPDLPVFTPDAAFLRSVEDALCELPAARKARFITDYKLSEEQAALLCEEKPLADYYESATAVAFEAMPASCVDGVAPSPEAGFLQKSDVASRTAALLLGDVKHLLTQKGIAAADIATSALTAARLASLVSLAAQGKVSAKNAKQCLQAVFDEDREPAAIIKERGWEMLTDSAAIEKAVAATLEAEAATVTELKAAKAACNEKRVKTLGSYLAGKVIASTGGRADPAITGRILAEKLAFAD
jgi:aspartyl-tRNA(Asn)/glutamyl-tRNA(Gln) amidotransferase subunit B